ncbi:MAG: F0F1 ATP synthase subunit B, partial [Lactococcus lactis]
IQVANDTASQNRAKVLATANEEATSLKKRAQEDIEQERKEALNTVKGDVADISVQIAEKLIGQSLDASAQQELIDSYLAKLGE